MILSNNQNSLRSQILRDARFRYSHPRWRIPMYHSRRMGSLGRLFLRDIDLVHFPCQDIWYSPRGKAVVTIHDLAPIHFPERFFKNQNEERRFHHELKMIAHYATVIVSVSDHTKKDILRYLGVEAERVRTVHNAIDPFFISPEHGIDRKGKRLPDIPIPYFIFVGALDFRKNIIQLLEAFSIYRQRGGQANLVLVGNQDEKNPNYYPPIQPVLDQMAERDRVVYWLKDVTDDALPRLYGRALGLVFPSIHEGFGYPLIEAMACGTPIIAAKRTSLPEVAGDAALFVEPSAEELAQAMMSFQKDPVLRERLVALGKKRLEHFMPDRLAREMGEVYRDAAFGKV